MLKGPSHASQSRFAGGSDSRLGPPDDPRACQQVTFWIFPIMPLRTKLATWWGVRQSGPEHPLARPNGSSGPLRSWPARRWVCNRKVSRQRHACLRCRRPLFASRANDQACRSRRRRCPSAQAVYGSHYRLCSVRPPAHAPVPADCYPHRKQPRHPPVLHHAITARARGVRSPCRRHRCSRGSADRLPLGLPL